MSVARRCSGQRVTSLPARQIVPVSTRNVPATALRSVDLPEPLVPMTMTKDPSVIVRSTLCRARTSFGVPALNVFEIPRISSIGHSGFAFLQTLQEVGQDEGRKHENRSDQLQIIRI